MELPDKLKEFVRNNFIKLKPDTARHRRMHSLATARSIGIVFRLDSEAMYHIVHDLTRNLQKKGKEVKAVAYVPEKITTVSILPILSFDFIYKDDLNWFGKPKGDRIDEFMKRPFDLLLDLSQEDVFPLRYIVTRSVALCKTGRNTEENRDVLDIMISTGEDQDLRDFIENITHYLTLIETR